MNNNNQELKQKINTRINKIKSQHKLEILDWITKNIMIFEELNVPFIEHNLMLLYKEKLDLLGSLLLNPDEQKT